MTAETHKSYEQLLTFLIGEQWFGLPIQNIKDVMYTPSLTPVPLSSHDVAGLLNLRGHIVTAIQAEKFFGIPSKPDHGGSMCIVLQDQDEELYSFIVDKVYDIEDLPESDFEKLPYNLSSQWQPFATGIYKVEEKLIIVLSKQKMLSKLC